MAKKVIQNKNIKETEKKVSSSTAYGTSKGAVIAKYFIIGFIILSMIGSMFAYLFSAIQSV